MQVLTEIQFYKCYVCTWIENIGSLRKGIFQSVTLASWLFSLLSECESIPGFTLGFTSSSDVAEKVKMCVHMQFISS